MRARNWLKRHRLGLLAGLLVAGLAGYGVAQQVAPQLIVGGVFQTTQPTLQNLQPAALALDASGNLKVNVAIGGGTGGTASTFGAAFPGTGTAAGFQSPTGTMTQGNIDASGFIKVNCATGCSSGTFNDNADAVATNASNGQVAAWMYGFNGATFDRLQVDASKNLKVIVNSALPAGGNVIGAVTQSGTWNVSLSAGSNAIGSVTASTGSVLAVGNVTGAQVAALSGANLPLQLDTAGSLRVNIMSSIPLGASSSFNAAFPTTGTPFGAKFNGNMVSVNADTSSNLLVNVQARHDSPLQTFATGALIPLLVDTNGRLITTTADTTSPVSGTVSAAQSGSWTVTASTGATLATGTVTGGPVNALSGGNLSLQLDTSGTLRTNCVVGCSAGTFNNNADGVATSAVNSQAAAWLYGFNGTTWDRIRADANKNLQTNVQTGSILIVGTAHTNAQAVSDNANAALQLDTNGNLRVTGGLTDGASASGVLGSPIMAKVGTTQPVLTNGNLSFVSLDTAGSMRTRDTGGCARQPISQQTFTNISTATSATLLTGTASQNIYICSIDIVAGSATNVAMVEGTGTVCATGIRGMAGGTTAATGWNFAANGGLTKGDGIGAIYKTNVAGDNVCLLLSASNQVSGSVTWVTATQLP